MLTNGLIRFPPKDLERRDMTCSSRGLAQLGLLLKRFGVDGLDEDLDNCGTTDLCGELFSTTNRNE